MREGHADVILIDSRCQYVHEKNVWLNTGLPQWDAHNVPQLSNVYIFSISASLVFSVSVRMLAQL